MAKTSSKPVRYNEQEWIEIRNLIKRTKPQISVSELQRRAMRFALPKFASGEVPITDTVVLLPLRKKNKTAA